MPRRHQGVPGIPFTKGAHMIKTYLVAQHNNYDNEITVWLFENVIEAQDFLLRSWEDYYNTELAEQGSTPICLEDTWHEIDYAQVAWENGDIERWSLREAEKH